MSTSQMKSDDIREIMECDTKAILRNILINMDDWRVSKIKQALHPRWQDGFHFKLFAMWYRHNDKESPAREFYTSQGRNEKHYPSQGWAPEDDGVVEVFKCNLCGTEVDDDDILLDHFRYTKCDKFNEMVEDSISETAFWTKMEKWRNE